MAGEHVLGIFFLLFFFCTAKVDLEQRNFPDFPAHMPRQRTQKHSRELYREIYRTELKLTHKPTL